MACSFPGCTIPTPGAWCLRHGKIYGPQKSSKPAQPLTLPELLEKAQKEFNRFIRDRDRPFGCITCGSSVEEAGHYIPVGENSALRFEEDNAWGQCHQCNQLKTGNRQIYRAVLIQKIGLERVVELETFPKFQKFSRPQLENIISHYSSENKVPC